MAQVEPIVFIHGLFQAPFASDPTHFLAPNPVLVPDLPSRPICFNAAGYGTIRRSDH